MKKKILLTGIVTIFAFIVTIGTTYAWFTLGNSSSVSEVELNVSTDVSLLIMMDDGYNMVDDSELLTNPNNGDYVTELTNAQIQTQYAFQHVNLQPITTEDGINMEMRNGDTASFQDLPGGTGVYIEFKVWLLSQDKDVSVGVKDLSVAANSGDTLKDNVVDGVRLGIETADEGANIFGSDKDYDFAYTLGQNGYDDVTLANNIINPSVESTLIALHGLYYLSTGTETVNENETTLLDSTEVMQLTTDIPELVTIRIWAEGWDEDINDNVLNAVFDIEFGFIVRQTL
jgi:hypothetical protein